MNLLRRWIIRAKYLFGVVVRFGLLVLGGLSLGGGAAKGQCPALHTFEGAAASDYLGWGVAPAGDLDADGYDDILVGVPGYDDPELGHMGRAYVYSGRTGDTLLVLEGEYIEPAGGGPFGIGLDGGADADGDEVPDYVVGQPMAYGDAGWMSGKVYLFSGATGEVIWDHEGELEGGQFARAVAFIDDLDADGLSEVIVGARGDNGTTPDYHGEVFVYSGADGSLIWSWLGENPSAYFGDSVSSAGDFDDDGFADILIGSPGFNAGPVYFSGKAYVYSGATGELLWSRAGTSRQGMFGNSVSGAGDLNGDGCDDVIVGAYHDEGPIPNSDNGMAYVFAGDDGALLWSWEGESFSDFFGHAVAGPGDVNGDGVPDVVAGAYGHWGPAGWMSGKAYCYSGATGALLWSWAGEGVMSLFGYAVSGVGDVNNDGRNDVVVGAMYHDGPAGYDSGEAYVFSPVTAGDFDCNGVIELVDYAPFVKCLRQADIPATQTACRWADLNADDRVDLRDFARFQTIIGEKR